MPPTIIKPIPTGTVTGVYANQQDLQTVWGTTNVAQWSQLDGSPTPGPIQPNTGKILAALLSADNIINSFFQDGPFSVPLPSNPGSLSGASSQVFDTNRWAVTLAACELYNARMMKDKDTESKVSEHYDSVMADMTAVKNGVRKMYPMAVRRWPTSSAPFALG